MVEESPEPAVTEVEEEAEQVGEPASSETAASDEVADDGPRHISAADYLGRRPNPAYPRQSQRRREQGRVVIRVLISEQGKVVQASVQQSSGHGRLDDSALKAAHQAQFRPYTENGVPRQAFADIPFDFVL